MTKPETIIKAAILQDLLRRDELTIGDIVVSEHYFNKNRHRADLLVCQDRLCAFEIKSSQDSLIRLADQCDAYRCFFEKTIVVVHEKHELKAADLLPLSIGLWVYREDGQYGSIRRKRQGQTKNKIKKNATIMMLRVSDLNHLLKTYGYRASGRRPHLARKARLLPTGALRHFYIGALKQKYSRTSREFWSYCRDGSVSPEAISLLTATPKRTPYASSGSRNTQSVTLSPSTTNQKRAQPYIDNSDLRTFRYLQKVSGYKIFGEIPDDLANIAGADMTNETS